MTRFPLTGLIGSNPLGAMAAFGLLRVASQLPQVGRIRLSWQPIGDWVAVLHADSFENEAYLRDQLLDGLVNHQSARTRVVFPTGDDGAMLDDVKVDPADFAGLLGRSIESCTPTIREMPDFLAALGCEITVARTTGDVKPTAFHMTAGQQKFLKSARELAESLDPVGERSRREPVGAVRADVRSAFESALFGPWRRKDPFHSLGWDPATEALHALSDVAPTAAGPTSERAALWLAFESLPLFPCAPNGRRLLTRGFDQRSKSFSWPIWEAPISVATLASLLGLKELVAPQVRIQQILPRGIVAVYRSQCQRDANGRGTFRHALCAGGRL